jgi:hypothetical protein
MKSDARSEKVGDKSRLSPSAAPSPTQTPGTERYLSTPELVSAFALEGTWQITESHALLNRLRPLQRLRLLAEDAQLEAKRSYEGDPSQKNKSPGVPGTIRVNISIVYSVLYSLIVLGRTDPTLETPPPDTPEKSRKSHPS